MEGMTQQTAPVDVDAGPLGGDVSFLLARANAVAGAAASAALKAFDLKVRSYAVLALAGSDARMNQREIAEYLRLDPSQVVALVDDLQKRGLAAREPDTRDRRTNVVTSTTEGESLLAEARTAVAEAEHRAQAPLTRIERDMLSHLLRRVAFDS